MAAIVLVLGGCASAVGESSSGSTTSERVRATTTTEAATTLPPTTTSTLPVRPPIEVRCPPDDQVDHPLYSQQECFADEAFAQQMEEDARNEGSYVDPPDPYEGYESEPDDGDYESGIDDYELPEPQYP